MIRKFLCGVSCKKVRFGGLAWRPMKASVTGERDQIADDVAGVLLDFKAVVIHGSLSMRTRHQTTALKRGVFRELRAVAGISHCAAHTDTFRPQFRGGRPRWLRWPC